MTCTVRITHVKLTEFGTKLHLCHGMFIHVILLYNPLYAIVCNLHIQVATHRQTSRDIIRLQTGRGKQKTITCKVLRSAIIRTRKIFSLYHVLLINLLKVEIAPV